MTQVVSTNLESLLSVPPVPPTQNDAGLGLGFGATNGTFLSTELLAELSSHVHVEPLADEDAFWLARTRSATSTTEACQRDMLPGSERNELSGYDTAKDTSLRTPSDYNRRGIVSENRPPRGPSGSPACGTKASPQSNHEPSGLHRQNSC